MDGWLAAIEVSLLVYVCIDGWMDGWMDGWLAAIVRPLLRLVH